MELKCISVKDVKSIIIDESTFDIMEIVRKISQGKLVQFSFTIKFLDGAKSSQIMIKLTDDFRSAILWALAIDGLRFQHQPLISVQNGCCIDNSVKILLLRSLYKSGHKGGIVKSGEEDWQYNSGGSVNCLVGETKLSYTWTGEFLQPSIGANSINKGTGRWDGVNLYWFGPGTAEHGVKNIMGEFYFSRKPEYHYIYDNKNREYLSNDGKKEWKWSRHFLASKDGEREWIVEGEIPEPVTILLQLLRYHIQDSQPEVQLGLTPVMDNVAVVRSKSATTEKPKKKRKKKQTNEES